jgi:hypothetical protein
VSGHVGDVENCLLRLENLEVRANDARKARRHAERGGRESRPVVSRCVELDCGVKDVGHLPLPLRIERETDRGH